MSKLTERLREVGVFNDHGFFDEKGQVWLSYHGRDGSRDVMPSRWFVYRRGYQTNPDAHWADYGNKTFSASRQREGLSGRASAFEDAKEWASARYGITEWKRSPFRRLG